MNTWQQTIFFTSFVITSLHRLVIAARTEDKLKKTSPLCHNSIHIYYVVADLSKEDCKEAVHVSVEKMGGIDIVILNTAYSPKPQWFHQFKALVIFFSM